MTFMKFVVGAILVSGALGCSKHEAGPATAAASPPAPAQAVPLQAKVALERPSQAPPTLRPQPVNAAPLGLELGFANVEGVKSLLGGRTRLEERGRNAVTGGPMLWSEGDGLDVDGLTGIVFVFDAAGVLAGVEMTVPKDPRSMMNRLSSKYTPVSNRINNFMNHGYAQLKKGDSIIEIDSPHLSFTMDVRYLTSKFFLDAARMHAESKVRKEQEQTEKL